MEQPKIELEEVLDEPKVLLDEEDKEDLIYDCYELLCRVLDRTNPQWLQSEGAKLKERLEETLHWHKMH